LNPEVQKQLTIAGKLGFGNQPAIQEAAVLSSEVGKMLTAMLRRF
jgi:hypothetical protein